MAMKFGVASANPAYRAYAVEFILMNLQLAFAELSKKAEEDGDPDADATLEKLTDNAFECLLVLGIHPREMERAIDNISAKFDEALTEEKEGQVAYTADGS